VAKCFCFVSNQGPQALQTSPNPLWSKSSIIPIISNYTMRLLELLRTLFLASDDSKPAMP
jgi:hypothetical protein